MKLKIPPKFQVGAHAYEIRISNEVLDIADLRGNVNYTEQVVRLSTTVNDKQRSASMIFEALIHEVLHPVNHLFMGGELTETQLEQISAGLTQVLLSLGIEPDFSKVPEEEIGEIET